MTREVVSEASAFTLRIRFSSGAIPVTPETVHYRNKDVTNDRIVRDWTQVTPAASTIDLEVIAEDNVIDNDRSRPFQRFEERVIIVVANRDTDTQRANEVRYLIKNLRGFDS